MDSNDNASCLDDMIRKKIVIVIGDEDLMGDGKPVHEFKLRDKEGREMPGPDQSFIYANSSYRDEEGSDLSNLFHDLYESDPSRMLVPVLRMALERAIKNSIEEILAEEGFEEGSMEMRMETARRMIARGCLKEDIQEMLELSADEIRRIAMELKMLL